MAVKCLVCTLGWNYTLFVAENLLHAGLCKQWGVVLLPYVRLTSSSQASAVSGLLWNELGLSLLLSFLSFPLHVAHGVHWRHTWMLARRRWEASCLDRGTAIPHQGKHPHWRRIGLGSTYRVDIHNSMSAEGAGWCGEATLGCPVLVTGRVSWGL